MAGDIYDIIIADDHPVARSGLEFLLRREPGVDVVGCAGDGDEALALIDRLSPDLVLLDLALPRKSGLLVLETLTRRPTRPRVLIISGQASGLDFKRVADLGAEGIVSKEDESEELLAAVRAVRSGETYRSTAVTALLGPLARVRGRAQRQGEPPSQLTTREREVLALVAEGCSNAEIGRRLAISPKTAKKHRENIRGKLGISTAVEATRAAARLGLTKL